jgi:hypothetical protein
MNSIRERLLREVLARLSVAIAPVPVLRHPTVPVTREASPALLMFAEGDSITAHANSLAHAALLADPNLGGLALAVREIDCEWDAEDADAGAVSLPARYEVRYRTHAIDLTKTG